VICASDVTLTRMPRVQAAEAELKHEAQEAKRGLSRASDTMQATSKQLQAAREHAQKIQAAVKRHHDLART
jgi:hypothetical protein